MFEGGFCEPLEDTPFESALCSQVEEAYASSGIVFCEELHRGSKVRAKISYLVVTLRKEDSRSCLTLTSKSGHSVIPPRSPFIPTDDDGNVGEMVSNARGIVYNASQRGRKRPYFDLQASPAKRAFVTRYHLGKRNQRQHRRGPSSLPLPHNRSLSCGITRGSSLLFQTS